MVKSIKLLFYLTISAAESAPLLKKNIFFKPGRFGTSIFPPEMAWSSHLINVTTQKAEKKGKKSHFFSTIFHLYLDYKLLDCFGTTVD